MLVNNSVKAAVQFVEKDHHLHRRKLTCQNSFTN